MSLSRLFRLFGLPFAAASSQAGCDAPQAEAPSAPVDGWEVVRNELFDGNSCYLTNPAYCIRDPAFVDPIIQKILQQSFQGVMPATESDAKAVARRVKGEYQYAQLATPEARARVETLVRALYANPPVKQEDGLVLVEMGRAPGPFVERVRGGWDIPESDVVEDNQWKTTEAARVLSGFAARYPTAGIVRVTIQIPKMGSFETWTYEYRRLKNVVVVSTSREAVKIYFTPPLEQGWAPYLSGALSLHTRQLKACTLADQVEGDVDCVQ